MLTEPRWFPGLSFWRTMLKLSVVALALLVTMQARAASPHCNLYAICLASPYCNLYAICPASSRCNLYAICHPKLRPDIPPVDTDTVPGRNRT
jgi:hypothetical protein